MSAFDPFAAYKDASESLHVFDPSTVPSPVETTEQVEPEIDEADLDMIRRRLRLIVKTRSDSAAVSAARQLLEIAEEQHTRESQISHLDFDYGQLSTQERKVLYTLMAKAATREETRELIRAQEGSQK